MAISPKILYDILLDDFGHQHWWPIDKNYHRKQKSDPRFEIIVGAILTQNTAWNNVEKALENLKKNKVVAINSIIHYLVEELLAPSYRWNGPAIRLEAKEQVKKRIHRSPDDSDALALAVAGHLGRTGGVPRLSVW